MTKTPDIFPVLDIPIPRGRSAITQFEFGQYLADFGKVETGEALRVRKDTLGKKGYHDLREATVPYLDKVLRHAPYSYSFMEGVAHGTGVDIYDVGALYTQELYNPENSAATEHCTTAVNPRKNDRLLVHNEEWNEPGELLYVFRATIEEGVYMVSLLGLGYKTEPPGGSVTRNNHGIIQAVNSLHNHTNQIGVPRTIVAFELAKAKGLLDTRKRVRDLPLASAMNYIQIDPNGGINVETAGGEYAVQTISNQRSFVHANFITAPKLKGHDNLPSPNSESRVNQVTAQIKPGMSTRKVVEIMSDSSDATFPVFSHDTLATVYALTGESGLHIRRNHQPNNKFNYYRLRTK